MAREATLTVETMERENTRDIPIRITASYIFAGPAVQPGKDCFQCFRRSLEDNESYLAGIQSTCRFIAIRSRSARRERKLRIFRRLTGITGWIRRNVPKREAISSATSIMEC